MAKWYERAWDSTGGKLIDAGRDAVRDLPILGGLLGQESSATRAARAQTEALQQAGQQQAAMYEEAKGMLTPYSDLGSQSLTKLSEGIQAGQFDPGAFSYSKRMPSFEGRYNKTPLWAFKYDGPQMSGAVDYTGSQPGQFSYSGPGQQGSLDYSGSPVGAMQYSGSPVGAMQYSGSPVGAMQYSGSPMAQLGYADSPVDRSISSYMQEDPGLEWQQEQLAKAIDRAGAAKGRWGGGATAREMMREQQGLLSQDYANRFNRAAMERAADVGAEQQRYGRALTDFDIARQAEQQRYGRSLTANEMNRMQEQQQYDRALTGLELSNLAESSDYNRQLGKYGLDVSREQDAYQRAYNDTQLGNLAAQDAYQQAKYSYQTDVDREQKDYDRERRAFADLVMREQTSYDRALGKYGMESERLANQLAQYQGLANLGPQMAQTIANLASGQGSALSNLAIQQGNVAAARHMGNANQLGGLLDLFGRGAQLYGSIAGMPT